MMFDPGRIQQRSRCRRRMMMLGAGDCVSLLVFRNVEFYAWKFSTRQDGHHYFMIWHHSLRHNSQFRLLLITYLQCYATVVLRVAAAVGVTADAISLFVTLFLFAETADCFNVVRRSRIDSVSASICCCASN
jgi:hypothetical protein